MRSAGFRYDPSQPPDAERWLEIDEQTRVELVLSYLQRQENAPVIRMRAALWAVIENQLALGMVAVVAAAARLTNEGLTRPRLIGLLARELLAHMQELSAGTADAAAYDARLARLRAVDALPH